MKILWILFLFHPSEIDPIAVDNGMKIHAPYESKEQCEEDGKKLLSMTVNMSYYCADVSTIFRKD